MALARIALAVAVLATAVGGGLAADRSLGPVARRPRPIHSDAPSVAHGLKLGNQQPAGAPHKAAEQHAPLQPIRIEVKEGADPEAAWNDYFVSHKSVANGDDAAPSFASVRETVRKLMQTHEYEQVIALINAALRNQQGQPWMFEALGLAMQADRRPMAEIERALMSALDFTSDPT